MLRRAVFMSALAGCSAYQPSSFEHGFGGGAAVFEGERATVGCLDVAIARRPDHDGSAVLQYRFGNRCSRATEVDLQRVAVIGRFADGREESLTAYDPDGVLSPLLLGGRLAGREALAYPTAGVAVQVCVDAASIVHVQPARWMCFGRPGGALDADAGSEAGADAAADADAGAGTDSLDRSPEATP
jgi:hypothetical protein